MATGECKKDECPTVGTTFSQGQFKRSQSHLLGRPAIIRKRPSTVKARTYLINFFADFLF